MRHITPLVTGALVASSLALAVPAQGAVGNRYNDGQDLAVASAAGANFRLDTRRLEPGCLPLLSLPHTDVGDSNNSVHIQVLLGGQEFSIDQVLIPGSRTGYRVVNTFDTGTSTTDADIDPGQTAVNIDGPMYRDPITKTLKQDNVPLAAIIACVSDHEDDGQNEPYAASNGGPLADDGIRDANEVYAKNRPILKPAIASLGQGAVRGVKGYKLGLGYSVERWYSTATINDVPAFTLRLTDPMGFALDKVETVAVLGGTTTRTVIDTANGHVRIPPRIGGPRFDAASDGPGVLRVNDIDTAAENFDDPHFEFSNYDQTDVFNVRGDAQSFCLGGFSCAGIVGFGTQGDLPVTWSLKASLAAVDTLRSVSFTPAMFDAWEQGWQDYYCGKTAHPTLPLTPGTNSPDPRGGCPVVNPTETRPTTAPQVVVPVTVVVPAAATPKAVAPASAKKKATAKQRKAYRSCVAKANKKHGKAKTRARAKCRKMPH